MERLKHIRHKWPMLALIALYVYLAFHALSGSQGVMRWVDYQSDIDSQRVHLEKLQNQRLAMEIKATNLRADGIDLDALDIAARKNLFVSRPNEVTIWLDRSDEK